MFRFWIVPILLCVVATGSAQYDQYTDGPADQIWPEYDSMQAPPNMAYFYPSLAHADFDRAFYGKQKKDENDCDGEPCQEADEPEADVLPPKPQNGKRKYGVIWGHYSNRPQRPGSGSGSGNRNGGPAEEDVLPPRPQVQ